MLSPTGWWLAVMPVDLRCGIDRLLVMVQELLGRDAFDGSAYVFRNRSGTANAIDYTLRRQVALRRYLDGGRYPIDNNALENAIRPIALGRKNWLFAGSARAGEHAAAIMSLIATAKANSHDPHAWLTDVLARLPTTLDRDIGELLPHTLQRRS